MYSNTWVEGKTQWKNQEINHIVSIDVGRHRDLWLYAEGYCVDNVAPKKHA